MCIAGLRHLTVDGPDTTESAPSHLAAPVIMFFT